MFTLKNTITALALAGAMASPALVGSATNDPVSAGHGNLIANGVDFNGVDINGVDMNGVDMNGVDVNGVEINGVDVNGVDVNGRSQQGRSTWGYASQPPSTSLGERRAIVPEGGERLGETGAQTLSAFDAGAVTILKVTLPWAR